MTTKKVDHPRSIFSRQSSDAKPGCRTLMSLMSTFSFMNIKIKYFNQRYDKTIKTQSNSKEIIIRCIKIKLKLIHYSYSYSCPYSYYFEPARNYNQTFAKTFTSLHLLLTSQLFVKPLTTSFSIVSKWTAISNCIH